MSAFLDYVWKIAKPDATEQVPHRPPTKSGLSHPPAPPARPMPKPPRHDCALDGCDVMRAEARASLYYFAKHVIAWHRPAERNLIVDHFHKPLCDRAQTATAENPKQLILVPRGCLKTTLLVEAYSVWCLIQDPMDTILLSSATATLAEHTLRAIKAIFEGNELFQHLFPELIPADFTKTKWSESEIIIPRPAEVKEASIQTIGVGGTIVGHHFRRALHDDLINEKHRDSPSEMLKVDEWLRDAVNLLEDPDKGPELVVGTHWGHDDIYARRKREGQFAVYERAIREHGVTIFPEKYPEEALKRLEIRLGPYFFSANMMNFPVDPSRQIFRPEWFPEVLYTEDVALQVRGSRIYILVDPALSEKKDGSFTGYAIAAVGPAYATVILEAIKRRWNPGELIDRIFLDALRFGDDVDLVVEMRSLAKFLKYPIELRMRETGRFFRLIETPTPNSAKEERIRANLVPPAANLRFRFIQGACTDLLQDARDFPFGDGNYDALDTLSFLPQVWQEGTGVEPHQPRLEDDPMNMVHIMRHLRERGAAGENHRFALHRRAMVSNN